jgi:hypothetical protein
MWLEREYKSLRGNYLGKYSFGRPHGYRFCDVGLVQDYDQWKASVLSTLYLRVLFRRVTRFS